MRLRSVITPVIVISKSNAVAIGDQAGETNQQSAAVAIGAIKPVILVKESNAVAIGYQAGSTNQAK
jgi:hypothetical protein